MIELNKEISDKQRIKIVEDLMDQQLTVDQSREIVPVGLFLLKTIKSITERDVGGFLPIAVKLMILLQIGVDKNNKKLVNKKPFFSKRESKTMYSSTIASYEDCCIADFTRSVADFAIYLKIVTDEDLDKLDASQEGNENYQRVILDKKQDNVISFPQSKTVH